MNRRQTVWIEKVEGRVVRIFHTTKCEAFDKADNEGRVFSYPKKDATKEIRDQIFERAGGSIQEGFPARCELCGKPVQYSGPLWIRMHTHEKLWRGKRGLDGHYGDISLDNSIGVCSGCHDKQHEARNPRWGESRTENEPLDLGEENGENDDHRSVS